MAVLGSVAVAGGRDLLLEHKLTTVAVRLGAKGPTQNVHRLARAFDGPRGDGRSGARGVAVQGGQLWPRLGTRWRFGWLRGRWSVRAVMAGCIPPGGAGEGRSGERQCREKELQYG